MRAPQVSVGRPTATRRSADARPPGSPTSSRPAIAANSSATTWQGPDGPERTRTGSSFEMKTAGTADQPERSAVRHSWCGSGQSAHDAVCTAGSAPSAVADRTVHGTQPGAWRISVRVGRTDQAARATPPPRPRVRPRRVLRYVVSPRSQRAQCVVAVSRNDRTGRHDRACEATKGDVGRTWTGCRRARRDAWQVSDAASRRRPGRIETVPAVNPARVPAVENAGA